MTTTSLPLPSPTTSRLPVVRRLVAGAAIAGTLPYLGLKAVWLSGHPVGVIDPAVMESTSMTVLNGVTVAMDLCVIALAVALTAAWGRRLPAAAVLLPGWVASGLLLPIAVSVLPATLLTGSGGDGDGLAGWVRPLVYGGFAWQGAFLLVAFAFYARQRWSETLRDAGPAPEAVRPLMAATVAGGTVMAALSAVLQVLYGATSGGGAAGMIVAVGGAAFAAAGAAGVLALSRGTRTTATVVAGWSGSAAMFAWGLWSAATTMGASDLSAAGHPAYGLAQLTGLLGGFALAVAGLLALSGRTTAAHERPRGAGRV
ncbi:hypothetical protein EV383_2106 [Pseudonocardia sediminis]|uniref:Uncharacterized protein n=1 Tax=Pseudonocardia sediminis TaxID=1397368 RepID=A0A4Q7UTT5_PSEST|nr:hypothetical protein [Pseudonocardia sediminis]RZT85242.1 hypothetical protein EV383_2106 [Pseudonocardia sediminis]